MGRPLKIIIFDGSFKTTVFINRLASGLAEHHQIYILGFNEELTKKLKKIHYVPLGSNQNKFRFVYTTVSYAVQFGSIKKVFNTLKQIFKEDRQKLQEQNLRFVLGKIQPDIIHLQWPSVIPWFEEVLREMKIPVVLSQRGFHNNVVPFIDQDNFEYLKQWYPKISGFHSVSKAISLNGDKIWNSLSKINKVVYTGIPLANFPFFADYTVTQPLQLLSIGRAHWIKGYEYTLQCCKILKDQQLSFHYTIIGGASNEELQFLVADLGLENEVTLEGRLLPTEVFKLMESSSLLLMPSVEEGFPNVLVEAMALGLPVLSAECGGVPELVEDGVNGWLVPIRDSEALAEKVAFFIKLSLSDIEKVRKSARKRVEKLNAEQEMINGMENLYYSVDGILK